MLIVIWIFIVFPMTVDADLVDRHGFDRILESLWQYPLIKQTLIDLCFEDLNRCRNEKIFSSYIDLIDNEKLKRILQHRIHCFIHRTINCRRRDLMISRRICQIHRQCPPKSWTTDSTSKYFPSQRFFFFIPLIFMLICLPMWIFYYVYEIDFKIHASLIRLCSIWTRRDQQHRTIIDQEKNLIVD